MPIASSVEATRCTTRTSAGGNEGGALAFIGLLVATFGGIAAGISAVRTTHHAGMEVALGCAFLTYGLVGLSEPTLYERYGWLPLALLVASRKTQAISRLGWCTRRQMTPVEQWH